MKKPIIIINFKTYLQGDKAVKLAKIIKNFDKKIIIGVQPTDIYRISKETKLKVYSEHADPFQKGRNTGFIIPEAVKENGAIGVFLNHSEHRTNFNTLEDTIKICKKIKLKTVVFAKDLNEARKIEKLKPSYLVIEPPELVGGKISVSSAKPELIKRISNNLKMDFLVGAGIKNKKDVEVAMKLGASGVALSSAIANSVDPLKTLKEIFS